MNNYAAILKRNVAASLVRYLVVFAIAFFLTPIVVRALGDQGYGVWILVYSFVGYAGILEMGIMPATVKLISQYASSEMTAQRNAVANSAMVFYIGLGAIACILFWTLLVPIMHSMLGDSLAPDKLTAFSRIVGLDAFVSFASFPLMGIAYGLHQYHRQSQRDIYLGLANLVGSVAVLHLGWGLLGLAWVKFGLSVLGLIVLIFLCRESFSQIDFSLRHISRGAFKELFGVGFPLFIMQSMTRINSYAIPALITIFRNAAMTAYFNVAQTLVGRLTELLWSASAPFMPVFSEISGNKTQGIEAERRLRSIYLRGSRLIIAFSIPLYLGLFFLGPSFLGVWVGPSYSLQAGIPMRILVIEMAVIGFQPLLERMMVGQGHMRTYVTILTIGNIIGFFLLVGLIRPFGLEGVAAACLFRSIGIQLSLLLLVRYKQHIGIREYIGECIFPWIYGAGLQSFSLWIISRYVTFDGFVPIITVGAISTLSYIAGVLLILSREERVSIWFNIKNAAGRLRGVR